MEVGLNQGEAKYFKKSSEGIMHSSNLYDDMQVFLLRRDSRLLLLLLLVEKQLCWYTCPLYTCSASKNSDSIINLYQKTIFAGDI